MQERKTKSILFSRVFAVLAIIAALLLFFFNPAVSFVFPPCVFHKLTGLYCPGCGSLRAVHQLLHGDVIAAFGFNPLMVIALPFVAYGLLAHFLRTCTTIQLPVPFLKARWIWALLALIFLYTLARNLPWPPLTLLAPHGS